MEDNPTCMALAARLIAVYGERFLTRHEAQQVIFEYIKCYYNRIRRHSNNGWLSPVDYEAEYYISIEGMSGLDPMY